jgi:hypothetical protein
MIAGHDLTSLRELWQHLQGRLFKRLDPVQVSKTRQFTSVKLTTNRPHVPSGFTSAQAEFGDCWLFKFFWILSF